MPVMHTWWEACQEQLSAQQKPTALFFTYFFVKGTEINEGLSIRPGTRHKISEKVTEFDIFT